MAWDYEGHRTNTDEDDELHKPISANKMPGCLKETDEDPIPETSLQRQISIIKLQYEAIKMTLNLF